MGESGKNDSYLIGSLLDHLVLQLDPVSPYPLVCFRGDIEIRINAYYPSLKYVISLEEIVAAIWSHWLIF